MPFETIIVESDVRIATLTLDRASSGNAVNERMAFELGDACQQLDQDDDTRVVVITGKGDAFCLGTDPAALQKQGDLAESLYSLRVAGRIAAIEKPVIAALNGDATGQGLELALACDIRIASSQARFGMTQLKDETMPWDSGTQRLPRLVGRGRAIEMILTSRMVGCGRGPGDGLGEPGGGAGTGVAAGPGHSIHNRRPRAHRRQVH